MENDRDTSLAKLGISHPFPAQVSLILFFWAEAVAAWYTNPAGLCERQDTEGDCLSLRSPTNPISKRKLCAWDAHEADPDDACGFRTPTVAEATLANSWEAFICLLVALPFILGFEALWYRWVRAPVKVSDRFWLEAEKRTAAQAADGRADRAAERAVRVAGVALLQNLGVVDAATGRVVDLDLADALSPDARPPADVGSVRALTEWFATLATIPTMRLVLKRRRELRDALADCGPDAAFDDRREALEFLATSLDATWSAGQEKGAKFPTSKAHISVAFHSFRLIFGRGIISRNGLEA